MALKRIAEVSVLLIWPMRSGTKGLHVPVQIWGSTYLSLSMAYGAGQKAERFTNSLQPAASPKLCGRATSVRHRSMCWMTDASRNASQPVNLSPVKIKTVSLPISVVIKSKKPDKEPETQLIN
jgi:hypothetical protein